MRRGKKIFQSLIATKPSYLKSFLSLAWGCLHNQFSQYIIEVLGAAPSTYPQHHWATSKYIWVVVSFGGVPFANGFAKRYELHYQPKKMNVDGAEVLAQYGCINFHVKHYGGNGAKLTLAIKNKWSMGWSWVWFYCKVLLLRRPRPIRAKSVHLLRSSMAPLNLLMEPSFQWADDDSGELDFV
jgi:hypothetical protein